MHSIVKMQATLSVFLIAVFLIQTTSTQFASSQCAHAADAVTNGCDGDPSCEAVITYYSNIDHDPSTPDVFDLLIGESALITIILESASEDTAIVAAGFHFDGYATGDPVVVQNGGLTISAFAWDELLTDPGFWVWSNQLPSPQTVTLSGGVPVPGDGLVLATFTLTGIADGQWTQGTGPTIYSNIFEPPLDLADGSDRFDVRVFGDCNGNGVPDEIDIADGTSQDCNNNGVPDECDLEEDCNENGVPDECEPDDDCNLNGALDACDIANGNSEDCNINGVPDECELKPDCNDDGVPDECEIQGWQQVAKPVARDALPWGEYGYSTSVSGDVAVIGARSSGSAYVFRRNGTIWIEEQTLVPDDGADNNRFGVSVSISDDIIVIGEDLNDDNGVDSGAAHVFRWNGTNWAWEQKLLANDGAENDQFGFRVSVSGDAAVVGAIHDGDNGIASGSAYVFRRNGANWVQEQKLLPDDGASHNIFGISVSVSGDTAVIGASLSSANTWSVGRAYVFRRNGANWVQEQRLLAADGQNADRFGFCVSVSGDLVMVGAFKDNDLGVDSGSAYAFRWNGAVWAQEQKLLPDDGAAFDFFGRSLSVSGDLAVIGAYQDDNFAGSAYAFRWSGKTWVQEEKLLPDDGVAHDYFGTSVSVSGDLAVIGAYQDTHNGVSTGSAYVFQFGDFDCNGNEIPDECDIADGFSQDLNENGIPDECESAPIPGDCDSDGDVDLFDYECYFFNCVTGPGGGVPQGCDMFDFDGDADVDLLDWSFFQIVFTAS